MATNIQNDQPFTRTIALALIGIGSAAFFGAIIIYVFADLFNPDAQVGANSYSRSAIGHSAAVELLEEIGIEVAVSRRSPDIEEDAQNVLIFAEPAMSLFNEDFVANLPTAPVIFLVLPKRSGIRSPIRPNWIDRQFVLPESAPLSVLNLFLEKPTLIRPEEDQVWQDRTFPGLVPELEDPQLFTSDHAIPLIESDGGILLGRTMRPEGIVYILSDPDLIANHGLADGDNAAIFVHLMALLDASGPISWDETRHGFELTDNVWRSAFEMPLLPVTIATGFAVVILLLVTTYRFGSPLPAPEAQARGKPALVAALADLLSLQRHHNELMRRYLTYGLRDMARRMNAPARMSELQAIHWIVDIGVSRGMARTKAELPLRVFEATNKNKLDNAALTRLIRNFYQWKMELLDGSH